MNGEDIEIVRLDREPPKAGHGFLSLERIVSVSKIFAQLYELVGAFTALGFLSFSAWIAANFSTEIRFPLWACFLALSGCIGVVTLVIFRRTRKRMESYESAARSLHRLNEHLRAGKCSGDIITTALLMGGPVPLPHGKTVHDILTDYCDDAAEKISVYFREITLDDTIGCCLRLALPNDECQPSGCASTHVMSAESSANMSECGADEELRHGFVYHTVGRSRNLDVDTRRRSSQPLPATIGLARFLMGESVQKRGCVIIRHVPTAVELQIMRKEPNNQLGDIVTLIACPVNELGDDLQERRMVGILYLTSRKNPFNNSLATQLAAVADLLPMTTNSLVEIQPAAQGRTMVAASFPVPQITHS